MKLAQFIQAEMEQLLKDWEEAALEIAPELRVRTAAPWKTMPVQCWSSLLKTSRHPRPIESRHAKLKAKPVPLFR